MFMRRLLCSSLRNFNIDTIQTIWLLASNLVKLEKILSAHSLLSISYSKRGPLQLKLHYRGRTLKGTSLCLMKL